MLIQAGLKNEIPPHYSVDGLVDFLRCQVRLSWWLRFRFGIGCWSLLRWNYKQAFSSQKYEQIHITMTTTPGATEKVPTSKAKSKWRPKVMFHYRLFTLLLSHLGCWKMILHLFTCFFCGNKQIMFLQQRKTLILPTNPENTENTHLESV